MAVGGSQRVPLVGAFARAEVESALLRRKGGRVGLATEVTSRGMQTGSMSDIFLKGFLVSNSTPRAVCASMMAFHLLREDGDEPKRGPWKVNGVLVGDVQHLDACVGEIGELGHGEDEHERQRDANEAQACPPSGRESLGRCEE